MNFIWENESGGGGGAADLQAQDYHFFGMAESSGPIYLDKSHSSKPLERAAIWSVHSRRNRQDPG